jgi:type VI secretion system secreted protein VgrG
MTIPVMASFAAEATAYLQWHVEGATVVSALNEPYLVRLEVVSTHESAEPLEMLGSSAELVLRHAGRESGYGGIVSSVRSVTHHGLGARAIVTVEPALSALRHTRDTRIFQGLSVPEVLAQVLANQLGPYGRAARQSLQRSYPKREYTVQYQESHFDFVHRLMEEEGIVYYFEQDGAIETMVLVDVAQAHASIGVLDYSSVVGDAGVHEREYVRSFEPASAVVGSEVTTRHFDWTRPTASIVGAASGLGGSGDGPDGSSVGPARESYQHDEALTLHGYAGAYQAHDATDQARLRREVQLRDARRFEAHSTCVEVRAGARIELTQHPVATLDAPYNVIAVQHFVGTHAQRSAMAEPSQHYVNRFSAVPADVSYRPRRVRPRPRVSGIQTAIVTGPPGEEIHTDEHGRVKVQFPWDRQGQMDDRTTCWIRCMQTSAGAGFGAFVLPRVGMEVVVAFVDGDPDRPLVTGTVYNGANPGPYPMPEKKMLTVFKSNSYPGGGGFNELRLDDTKNAEEIWLHGQKDWNTLILNDLNRDVLRDETQNVIRHRTRTVGVDETLSVGHDRTRRVTNDESIFIGANRTEVVQLDETLTVGVARTRSVGAAETVTVGAAQTITVGAARTINVAGAQLHVIGASTTTQVGGSDSLSVVGGQTVKIGGEASTTVGLSEKHKVGGSLTVKVGAMRTTTVTGVDALMVGGARNETVGATSTEQVGLAKRIDAGQSIALKAGSKISLTVGDSSIVLTPDAIHLKAPAIHLLADGDVNADSGGNLFLNSGTAAPPPGDE